MLPIRDVFRQTEFWIFLFAMTCALFNWPLISMTSDCTVMGIPSILIYLASIWISIILVLYLFDRGYSE